MNRDDIIRMAREAGSIDSDEVIETVFAAFAAAEREACAKVCDAYSEFRWSWWKARGDLLDQGAADAADELAQRIRSRA